MRILFVHQNFPGQFKFLAPALVRLGHEVVALSMNKNADGFWQGVRVVSYKASRSSTAAIHPWVSDFETKIIRAESCFTAAIKLNQEGFKPDAIVAHHGWGESMFLKQLWPSAKLGIYCEFFYPLEGGDTNFDPEFADPDPGALCRLSLKNLNNLMHFQVADAGISPTIWQASTFPDLFRKKISIIHDGIDTDIVCPKSDAKISLKISDGSQIELSRKNEIITFVNRNLEPYRGYHSFMRALPELLVKRPNARVLLVGGDDVSYGARPDPLKYGLNNWKDIFANEVRPQILDKDWSRVHFLGNLSYSHFLALLQISTVHVYLTYPFVLSWSLLESMSAGCAIVASDTQPVHEAIEDGKTGVLVNFFDIPSITQKICELLEQPDLRAELGSNARTFAIHNYDLKNVCLPKQIAWVNELHNLANNDV